MSNFSISNNRQWYDIVQDGNGGQSNRVRSSIAPFVSVNTSIDSNNRKVLSIFYYDSISGNIRRSFDRSPDMEFQNLDNLSNINNLVGYTEPNNFANHHYYYTDNENLYSRLNNLPLTTFSVNVTNVKLKKYISSSTAYFVLSVGSNLYSIKGDNIIDYTQLANDYDGRDFYPYIDDKTQITYLAYTNSNGVQVLTPRINDGFITTYGTIVYTSAKLGNSAIFKNTVGEAATNYILIQNTVTNPLSISVWFNTTDTTTATQTVFALTDDTFNNKLKVNFQRFDGSAGMILYIEGTEGAVEVTSPTTIVTENTWYHVCVTIDSSYNSILYINGINEGTVVSSELSSVAYIFMGGNGNGTESFTGYIDELNVYNRAISNSEVTTLYELGTVFNDLIAQYTFDAPISNLYTPTVTTVIGNVSVTGSIKNNSGVFNNNNNIGSTATNYLIITNKINLPISIAFWFYPLDVANIQTIVSLGNKTNSSNSIEINLQSGNLSINVEDNIITSNIIILPNRWYSIFTNLNDSTIDLYVNGQKKSNIIPITSSFLTYADQFVIGCNNNRFINGFSGYLDEFYVFNNFNPINPNIFYSNITIADNTGETIYLPFDVPIETNNLANTIVTNYNVVGSLPVSSAIVGNSAFFINTPGEGYSPNNYITVSNTQNIPITTSCWFNTSNISNKQTILTFTEPTYSNSNVSLKIELLNNGTNNYLAIGAALPNQWIEINSANSYISSNVWYHVVATIDTSYNLKGYLNGVQFGTITGTGTGSFNQNSLILLGGFVGLRGFNGYIDEFIVYNRAINATEVSSLYNIRGGIANLSDSLNTVSSGAITYMPLDGNTRTSEFCVACGYGSQSSMTYSYDGINWYNGNPIFNSGQSNGVAYNDNYEGKSMWVAVGNGSDNNIAYSLDGINWIGCGTIFNSNGLLCIAYNSTKGMWIAGGSSYSGGYNLVYSYNGINWTPIINELLVNVTIKTICWSGSVWLAGGTSGVGSALMIYSNDGINWLNINVSNIFTTTINTICSNGNMFIAGGIGISSIAYSYDGIDWNMYAKNLLDGSVESIAWNGSIWVATGNGTLYYAIYSTNGIVWIASSNQFSNSYAKSVTWNGSMFVGITTSGYIVYSIDGNIWNTGNQGINKLNNNGTFIASSIVLPIKNSRLPNTLNITNGVMYGNVFYSGINGGSTLFVNTVGDGNPPTNYITTSNEQNISITVSVWFNSNDSTNFQTVLSFTEPTLIQTDTYLNYNASNRSIDIGTISVGISSNYNSVLPNTWNHVAFTFDASYNLIGYINGIQFSSGTGSYPLTHYTTILLGGYPTRGFNGYINEFMVYNKVLNASQIYDLFKLKNIENGRIIYFPLNESLIVPIIAPITTAITVGSINYTSAIDRNSGYFNNVVNGGGGGGGASNYIKINNTQNVPISFSLWFNTKNVTNSQCLFSILNTNLNNIGLTTNLFASDSISLTIGTTGATINLNPTILINTWYHLCITINISGNIIVYLNNKNIGSQTGALIGVNSYIVIANNSIVSFNGYIDDFAVYNRVLTVIEINDLYNLQNVTNGQIVFLPFDSPIVAPVVPTVVGTVKYTTSVKGNSAYFNNTLGSGIPPTNYLLIPYINSFPITISFWFNCNNVTTWQTPISLTNNSNDYIMNFDISSGTISIYIVTGGITGTSTPIEVNKWYHICTTIDSLNNQNFYVNGTLIGTSVGSLPLPSPTRFRIGGDSQNTRGFNGYIDEFIVYNRILNSSEVTKLANTKNLTDGVVIYAPLDKPTNSLTKLQTDPPVLLLKAINYSGSGLWNDISGNGFNATIEDGIIAKNSDGNGIVFNGSTSWQFPDVSVGNSWTVGIWYKQTQSQQGLACLITQSYNQNPVNLMIQPNGTVGFFNNGAWYESGGAFNITNNIWTNIQITWNGTNINSYINGILQTTIGLAGTATAGGRYYRIGRRWDGVEYINGEIGEIRMYNYVLNQSQIINDYNSSNDTFNRIISKLIYLKASDYSGSGQWIDETSNNNNATSAYGSVTVNTTNNGIILNDNTGFTLPNINIKNKWSINLWYKKNNTVNNFSGYITNGTNLYFSVDGINWVSSINNIFSGGNSLSVVYNGSYWIAVGYNSDRSICIAKSIDGINWISSINNPFLIYQSNAIAWNGSYWLAGGNSNGWSGTNPINQVILDRTLIDIGTNQATITPVGINSFTSYAGLYGFDSQFRSSWIDNEYLRIPFTNVPNFTISYWIYVTYVPWGPFVPLTIVTDTNSNSNFAQISNSNGTSILNYNNLNNSTSIGFLWNTWTQFTLTYNGTNFNLYRNNTLINTLAVSGFSNTQFICIGPNQYGSYTNGPTPFTGAFRQVCVFDYVLNSTQRTSLLSTLGNIPFFNNTSLAKSTDGMNWTPIINQFSSINGLSWNNTNNYWFSIGYNLNNTLFITNSTDGINWNSSSNPFNTSIINTIKWNGSYWLAGSSTSIQPINQLILNGSTTDVGTASATVTGTTNGFTNYQGKDCANFVPYTRLVVPCNLTDTSSFTFSFWYNTTTAYAGNWSTPVTLVGNNYTNGIYLGFIQNGTYSALYLWNNYTTYGGGFYTPLINSTWQNCILTYSNSYYSVYINGTNVLNASIPGSFLLNKIIIGDYREFSTWPYGETPWIGYVCQVCVFNYVLNSNQITYLYNNTQGNNILNTGNINSIAKSTDGINWTYPTNNLLSYVNKLEWNNINTWVAVGYNVDYTICIIYSTDGINWTASNNNPFSGGTGTDISWNITKAQWVATGRNIDNSNGTSYSSNGINWSTFNSNSFALGVSSGIIKLNDDPNGSIISQNIVSGNNALTIRHINDPFNYSIGFYNNSSWFVSTFTLVPNVWTNIQVIYDGLNLSIYLNNILLSNTIQLQIDNNSTGTYTIGKNSSGFINGEIGELSIYDYPLNQTKINSNYQTSFNTYLKKLVLLKAINYSGSGSWNDESGNNNNATLGTGNIIKNTGNNGIVFNGSTYWNLPNIGLGNTWSLEVWIKTNKIQQPVVYFSLYSDFTNSGSLTGSLNLNNSNQTFGNYNGYNCAIFNNNGGQYLTYSLNQTLSISNSYTFSFYFYTSVTSWQTPLGINAASGIFFGIYFNDNTINVYINNNWSQLNYVTILNQWIQITMTYNVSNNKMRFYINGIFNTEFTMTIPHTDINLFYIGSGAGSSGQPWNGYIRDIMLFNTLISDDNIIYIYNSFNSIQNISIISQNINSGNSVLNLSQINAFSSFSTGFTNNSISYNSPNFSIFNQSWNNISIIWDGLNISIYVNNILISSTQLIGIAINSGLGFTIGQNFIGEIGEIRIYNDAINQGQIINDYNESYNTFYRNLVLLKAINYNSTGSWNDESGYGNNATLGTGNIIINSNKNGFVLDGSTNWVLPYIKISNEWTVSVWYKNKNQNNTYAGYVSVGNGNSCLVYSIDGINWNQSNNNLFLGGSGNDVVYNGSYWIAIGNNLDNTVNILKSSNGISWIKSINNPFIGIQSNTIAWNGSYWLAGSNKLISLVPINQLILNGSATDIGSASATITGTTNGFTNYQGRDCANFVPYTRLVVPCNLTDTSSFTFSFWYNTTTAYAGNWSTPVTLVGNNYTNGIYLGFIQNGTYSALYLWNNYTTYGGGFYTPLINSTWQNCILTYSNSYYSVYINGTNVLNASIPGSFLLNKIIIGDYREFSTWPYGETPWIGYVCQVCVFNYVLDANQRNSLYIRTQGNSSLNSSSIAKSIDGLNWTESLNTQLSIVNRIAWNNINNYWIAVGNNSGSSICIVTSTNGNDWIASSTNPFLGGTGKGIVWNGLIWVAVGNNTSSSVCIATSSNGNNWTESNNNLFNGGSCNNIAYNGSIFVAIGTNSSNLITIAYSSNGTDWTASTSNPFSEGVGYGISWNTTLNLWVATFSTLNNENSIAYSTNGTNWTISNNNPFLNGSSKGVSSGIINYPNNPNSSIINQNISSGNSIINIGHNNDPINFSSGFYNNSTFYGSNFLLTSNVWTNIQTTWDGKTLSLYKNSFLTSSTSISNYSYNSGLGYLIGSNIFGEIGEIKMYDYVINQNIIKSDYNTSQDAFFTGNLPVISGLFNWIDTSDISTLYIDVNATTNVQNLGDPVNYILDKAGNADFSTSTTQSGLAPTYNPKILNLKSGLDFSNYSSLKSLSVPKSKNVTLFWVGTVTNNINSYGTLWGHFANDRIDYDIVLRRSADSGTMNWQTNGDNYSVNLDISYDQPVIYCATMENGVNMNFTMITNSGIYKNISAIIGLSWIEGSAPIYISADYSYNQNSNSFMSEIIYYQRVLNQTEIKSMISYLGNKWGIKTEVPSAPIENTVSKWLPNKESKLGVWLDMADYSTMIVNSNTAVSSITDKINNNLFSVQGSSSNLTLSTSGISNIASLYFNNNSGDNVYIDGSYNFNNSGSLLFVANISNITNTKEAIVSWNGALNVGFLNNNNILSVYSGANIMIANTSINIGNPTIVYCDWSGSNVSLSTNGSNLINGSINSTAFSPTSISGIALWLDAADQTSITLSGSNIAQWNDKSGNGYNAIGYGGLTYSNNNIVYNGSTGYFSTPYQSGSPVETGFAVVNMTNTNSFILGGTGEGVRIFSYQTQGFAIGYFGQTGLITNTTLNTNTTYLISYNYSSTSASINVNGTQAANSSGNYSAYSNTNTLIGGWSNGQAYIEGKVSEIIVFNTTLSESNRQKIEGYLAWKWGLNANLPIGHPYYYFSPNSIYTTQDTLTIGKHIHNVPMNFGELLVYSEVISKDARQKAEGYLASKWGLSSSLAVGHPYANVTPTITNIEYPLINVPKSFNGLLVWLDGADPYGSGLGTEPSIGTSINKWYDKSGNNNNFTQPLLGNVPTYGLDLTYNKNGILFNGTQFYNQEGSSFLDGLNKYTIICAYRFDAATNNPSELYRNYSGDNTLWYRYWNGSINVVMGGSIGADYNMSYGSISSYGSGISTMISDSTAATYLNGTKIITQYKGLTSESGNTLISIGAVNGAENMIGSIFEFLVFNYAMNDTERQVVESYLANKWGFGSKLPVDHQYYMVDNTNITKTGNLIYSGGTEIGGNSVIINNTNGSFSTNYLTIPNEQNLPLSINFWMNTNDVIPYQTVVGLSNASFNTSGLNIDILNGQLIAYICLANMSNPNIKVSINANNWYNVGLNIDNNYNGTLYLNGLNVGTTSGGSSSISNIANYTQFILGGPSDNSSRSYNGYIQNFKVYNRTLLDSEMNSLYNSVLVEDGLIINQSLGNVNISNIIKVGNVIISGVNKVSGISGGSALFVNTPGENQLPTNYITVLNSQKIRNTATASFWFNSTDGSHYQSILSFTESTLTPSNISLLVDYDTTNKRIVVSAALPTQWVQVFSPNNSVLPNIWYHVAFTINASYNLICYLNGINIGSITGTGIIIQYTLFQLGAGGNFRGFNGYIENFLVYNRVLSNSEVLSLYNQVSISNGLIIDLLLTSNPIVLTNNDSTAIIIGSVQNVGGIVNNCIYFSNDPDTQLQYVKVPNSQNLPISISFWMNSTNSESPYNQTVFGMGDTTFTAGSINFNIVNNILTVTFSFTDNPTISYNILPDIWYHVCLIIDSTYKGILYINGSPVGTNNSTDTTILNNQQLVIGGQCDGFTRGFNGYVDELRIYNRVLKPNEILSLYQLKNISYGLVTYLTFDGPFNLINTIGIIPINSPFPTQYIGSWSNSSSYNINDVVLYNNYFWILASHDTWSIGRNPPNYGWSILNNMNGSTIFNNAVSGTPVNTIITSYNMPLPISVGFWMYCNDVTQYQTPIGLTDNSNTFIVNFDIQNSVLSFNINGRVIRNIAILSNKWYHVSASIDETSEWLYLNGTKLSDPIITTLPTPVNQVILNGSAVDVGSALASITGSFSSYTNAYGYDCAYISTSNNDKLIIPCSYGYGASFTVSFWINLDYGEYYTIPIIFDSSSGSEYSIQLYMYAGTAYIEIDNNPNAYGYDYGSTNYNTWKNIAIVINGGYFSIYVDGSNMYLNEPGISNYNIERIVIGNISETSYWSRIGYTDWSGYIRQVCVFDSALSQEQITELYSVTQTNNQIVTQSGGGVLEPYTRFRLGGNCENDRGFSGYLQNFNVYNRFLSESEVSYLYNFNPPSSGLIINLPLNQSTYGAINTFSETVFGRTSYSIGKIGNAVNFNDGTSYITIPNSTNVPISICFWFKDTGYTNAGINGNCILSGDAFNNGFLVFLTGTLFKLYLAMPTVWSVSFTGISYNSGSWNHAAITIDSTYNVILYINGINVGTGTGSGNISNLTKFSFGSANTYSSYGSIDDFQVYNRSLQQIEINNIYNIGLNGKSLLINGLVTYLPFDNGPFIQQTVGIINYSGVNGGSAFFNNPISNVATDYLTITNTNNVPVSVAFWFNSLSLESAGQTLLSSNQTTGGISVVLYPNNNLTIFCALPTMWTTVTLQSININKWNHLCITVDSSFNIIVYLNGINRGTATGSSDFTNFNLLYLGGDTSYSSNSNSGFKGYIEDFMLYNRMLSSSEVTDIYNLKTITSGRIIYIHLDSDNFNTDDSNLVLNGSFETGDGTNWTGYSPDALVIPIQTIASLNDLYGPPPINAIYCIADDTTGIRRTYSQIINVTQGQSYTLSYYFATDGGPAVIYFAASLDGTTIIPGSEISVTEDQSMILQPWTLYTFNFVAQSSSINLTFFHQQDPSSIYLTGIRLVAINPNINSYDMIKLAELNVLQYSNPRIIVYNKTLHLFVLSSYDNFIYSTIISERGLSSIDKRFKEATDFKASIINGKLIITALNPAGILNRMTITNNMIQNYNFIRTNKKVISFDITNMNDEEFIFYIGNDNFMHQVWNPSLFVDINSKFPIESLSINNNTDSYELYPSFDPTILDYCVRSNQTNNICDLSIIINGTTLTYSIYPGQCLDIYNDVTHYYVKLLPNNVTIGTSITKNPGYIPGYYVNCDTYGNSSQYYNVHSSNGVPVWIHRNTSDPNYVDNPKPFSLFLGMGKNKLITNLDTGNNARTVIDVSNLEEENYVPISPDSRENVISWDVHESLQIKNPLARRGNIIFFFNTDGKFYIQEQNKNHEIVWEFWSEDLINIQSGDYFHFSSLDVHPINGNLLCSFRNCSTIACINYVTKNIDWAIDPTGGFATAVKNTSLIKFLIPTNEPLYLEFQYNGTSGQHDSRWNYSINPLTSGQDIISAFDNQSFNSGQPARGVIYEINLVNNQALHRGSVFSPDSASSGYMGSYKIQREINGTFSHVVDYVQQHPCLYEFEDNGNGMPTGNILLSMDLPGDLYRISKARPIDLDIIDMRKTSCMPISTLLIASQLWNSAASTNVTVNSLTSVTKTNNSDSYDAQIYSITSYVKPYFSIKLTTFTNLGVVGLSENPAASIEYANIDYGWNFDLTGPSARIYELGSLISTVVNPITNIDSIYEINFDGTNVNYLVDGVNVRSVARTSSNALFCNLCIYAANITLSNIYFNQYIN